MTTIRKIQINDVSEVKLLADASRFELGFNPQKKFEEVAFQKRAFVAIVNQKIIGFVIFRHRKRDLQTTLSEICVQQQFRGQHIGAELIAQLVRECRLKSREFIQLKCPVDLPANQFYRRFGFRLHSTELGKKRNLNVWRLPILPSQDSKA